MQATDQDEKLPWFGATIIMLVATLATIASRLLGTDPFTDIFDLFIVYLPTAVLVGGVIYGRSRGQSALLG